MWTGFSMMIDHHWSGWAWLWLAPLIVFGIIIYVSDPATDADVEVGENICFPVHWCIPGTTGESAIDADGNVEVGESRCFPTHWCIPGTTGESAIDADGNVEVGENRCFPAHWCIPGTVSGESSIELAPTSDAPPSAEQIKPGRQSLSSTTRPASSKT